VRVSLSAFGAYLKRLKDPAQIDAMLDPLMCAEWGVYFKPCLTHTETVINYLGC
jgi:hypothetical protein